ncbi:hypothetical protein Tco_0847272 [Tanacetum coccineum]
MSSVMVLDEECLTKTDISKSLFYRVKVFASLANLKPAIGEEGFEEIKIIYMLIKKIANRWGDLIDFDDQEDNCYHSKRLCVHTKSGRSILENFKMVYRGKAFWVRASETVGWVPDFADDVDEEYRGKREVRQVVIKNNGDMISDDDSMKHLDSQVDICVWDDILFQKYNHTSVNFLLWFVVVEFQALIAGKGWDIWVILMNSTNMKVRFQYFNKIVRRNISIERASAKPVSRDTLAVVLTLGVISRKKDEHTGSLSQNQEREDNG